MILIGLQKNSSVSGVFFHPQHRRNEERGQGGPSKIGGKRTKKGPFWVAVFHENTSGKSKFSSKGAEFFLAPKFYSSIVPMQPQFGLNFLVAAQHVF